jgi:hypothetical protein
MLLRQQLAQFAAAALLWAFAFFPSSAAPHEAAIVRAQSDGLSVDVTVLRDHVAFCIKAGNDLKISSEYGVEFKVDRRDTRLWDERLPKVVTGAGYYFDLPLRIDLKSRGDVRSRRVELDMGACSKATYCKPVRFKLTMPSNYATAVQCGSGAM